MYMHHMINAKSLPDAYHLALLHLNTFGDIRDCPAYNTREKSISITIDISRPLAEPKISTFIPCGPAELQQYVMEMTDGILDFETRQTHNWEYTYHDRMVEQLVEVVRILRKDRNSRRAVIMIRRPEDIQTDDPPCLTMIQYLINDNSLDCFVTFRSNDAVKAFFMNAFALIEIQHILADILNCQVGHYVHTANSFHAYERDWELLKKFCMNYLDARDKHNDNFATIVYDKSNLPYMTESPEECWKDMMEEEIPDIMEKVSAQMEKHDIKVPGYYTGDLKQIILRELGEI